ncbi:hypothetical protein [Streptomyces litmocidini]|uniref:hypothetical protein n=1 Tax=Streptomyces litmocidini TaxID=67318 RepID=UPI00167CB4AF|nr:hypothetical protein [Streptomyces litmocidini]
MERYEQDPVRLVVFDEPLPEGAERDPGVRAAFDDVAILREQLAFIGTALAGSGDGAETAAVSPPPRPRSRRRRVLRPLLAGAAAVAVLGTGAAYLVAHNGVPEGEERAKPTAESVVACATDIAEGTVAKVEQLGGDDGVRVVLTVEHAYKPTTAQPRLVFTAQDSGASYFRTGARLLVLVSGRPGEAPVTFREGDRPPGDFGEDVGKVRDGLEYGRKWVEKALPGSIGIDCSDPG